MYCNNNKLRLSKGKICTAKKPISVEKIDKFNVFKNKILSFKKLFFF